MMIEKKTEKMRKDEVLRGEGIEGLMGQKEGRFEEGENAPRTET